MIALQYRSFFLQSVLSFVIYGATLIAIGVIVTLPFASTSFTYSPHITLDNAEFNTAVLCLGLLGFFSMILSIRPTVSAMFGCAPYRHQEQLRRETVSKYMPDIIRNVDFSDLDKKVEEKEGSPLCSLSFLVSTAWFLFTRAVFTALVLAPVFAPFIYFGAVRHKPSTLAHVYFKPASNHTVIVRCDKLNQFGLDIEGISQHLKVLALLYIF
jgi:hypothetical protein